jgi:AcrR family transcriptional regulator
MPRVSEAHRAARRRQILDAAIDCFAREGFHRTSMSQIIARSGMSAGAIYLHFASKDDIVEAIAEERHSMEDTLAAAALGDQDTRRALHELARHYIEWLSDPVEDDHRRVTVQVWAEALRNDRVAGIVRAGVDQRLPIAEFLRQRQQRGEVRAGIDPDALSRVMLSIILGFVLQRAWDPGMEVGDYRVVLDAMIDEFVVAVP